MTTSTSQQPFAVATSTDRIFARAKAEYLLGRTGSAEKHLRAFLKQFPQDRNADDARVLLDRLH